MPNGGAGANHNAQWHTGPCYHFNNYSVDLLSTLTWLIRLHHRSSVFHKNVIISVNTLCHVSSSFKNICTIMVQISELLLHYTTTEICCFYNIYIYTAHYPWSFDDYDKPVYRNVFIILFMRSLTSIIHHV